MLAEADTIQKTKSEGDAARSESAQHQPRKKSGKFKEKTARGSSGTATGGEPKTRKSRAKKAGVSAATMAKAETLKKNAPDLYEKVCQQTFTLK